MVSTTPRTAAAPGTTGIFLNQVGYTPGRAKVASVRDANVADLAFRVRSVRTRSVVFKGVMERAARDAASGDQISPAVFTAASTPGEYVLEAGDRASDPFVIREDAYGEALRLTMRAFFGQRCGCKVNLGNGYKHGRCHKQAEFHASAGRSGKVRNRGGWHDAGDYGRYVVNSGITTGTLLWAWEMFPGSLRSLYLKIPESGGQLPDLLAEVRWNLRWMMSLQDADGGVWQKQTSERFCAFIMPEKDHLPSYVIGTGSAPYKSTAATADLAAVGAIAARCYAPFDPAFSQECKEAASRAWTWAMAHPDVTFRNPSGVTTGEYGDRTVSDELLWASAEMWRTTGEAKYERHFLSAVAPSLSDLKIGAPGWNSVSPMAHWTYVMAERAGSADVKDRIRAATRDSAKLLMEQSTANGYGNTLGIGEFQWGSNSVAANQSLLLLIADRFQPEEPMFEVAMNNLDYLLGRNCHGVSWVTHLGTRPFLHPHHRPSAADRIAEPWPGLLSGGPNAHPGDPVARTLPTAPPMRMWIDDERAYSMNEVAINWNAPLVFLLAAANEPRPAQSTGRGR